MNSAEYGGASKKEKKQKGTASMMVIQDLDGRYCPIGDLASCFKSSLQVGIGAFCCSFVIAIPSALHQALRD
jgi:hypothetical protein